MEKNKLTYKDFKIGQKVICCEGETDSCNYTTERLYDMYMTVGKEYTITDLDFHFPDAICVKKDNGRGAFFPIACFVDEEEMKRIIREKKLKRIVNGN